MPIYHDRVVIKSGKEYKCNRPFVQSRCPVCGKIVGFQIKSDAYWPNTEAMTFCSPECVQQYPCTWETILNLNDK